MRALGPALGTLLLAPLLSSAAAHAQLDETAVPPPAPPPPPLEPVEAPAPSDHRPTTPWALGLGAGWSLPQDILVPNTASARLAFPGIVTLEPFVNLSYGRQTGLVRFDAPLLDEPEEDETETNALSTGVGALVRVPVFTRGNLDLEALASVSVNHSVAFSTLSEEVETTSNVTTAGLGWGIGIQWFFAPNLAARNPLLSWTFTKNETRTETEFVDPDTGEERKGVIEQADESSGLSVGAIFSPTIRLMIHLYF